jgi:hypothetical protein
VRKLVQKEIIVSRYVKSRENTANILTKTLSRDAHETEIRMLEFANMPGHDQMTGSSLCSEKRCWTEPPTEKPAKVRPDL